MAKKKATKRAKKQSLSHIPGVGPTTEKKLVKAGIDTPAKLKAASVAKLMKAGIPETTAYRLAGKRKPVKKRAPAKTTTASAQKAAARAMQDIIARARDHFKQAPEHHVFVVTDGQTIQDLRELAEALEDMPHETYGHHVNDDKHDFASWVHDVLHERALAEQLRRSKTNPGENQRIIYRHIVRRVW